MTTKTDQPQSPASVPDAPMRLAYRPWKFDDWGWLRDDAQGVIVRVLNRASEADQDAHRAEGTDPYAVPARYVMDAVNAHPSLLAQRDALLTALKAMVASYDDIRDGLTSPIVLAKLAAADAAIQLADPAKREA